MPITILALCFLFLITFMTIRIERKSVDTYLEQGHAIGIFDPEQGPLASNSRLCPPRIGCGPK